VKYEAGAVDMLSVLQLQEAQIESQRQLVELRNAQLANRIQLHLALGGGFDAEPTAKVAEQGTGGHAGAEEP
jgi:outer membrane protein, multidrug efflux system